MDTTHASFAHIARLALAGLMAASLLGLAAHPAGSQTLTPGQTPSLLYDEAQTVYLGNLARQQNGVPPLRWNAQLTEAARWFSWDSVENRAAGFCGHQDTQGHGPGDRARANGYLGSAGAENAFCGYVTPQQAIDGWMNSSGHRANLLDPNHREVGLGYYRRSTDGRGYVTQDFGADVAYPPVIIANEAISTTSPNVNLYIYDRETITSFMGQGPSTQMMVGNDVCLSGADWEPYNVNKSWTLTPGAGWRQVYVKSRDAFSRTITVSDAIYLGSSVPIDELGAAQMSIRQPAVTLSGLSSGGLPQMQFSLGWLADDSFPTFNLWWGNGQSVSDAAAWGGSAFRLQPGAGESFAWVYSTDFIKDVPLVAYFRLKVSENTSSAEVARISVTGGGTEYGPISLTGAQFNAPNQYQEFALPFTFNTSPNPDDAFLIFNLWRNGQADVYVDVYVDAISIFTAPQPFASSTAWNVPGGNYRGQGVWVRYTDGGNNFSAFQEASTTPSQLDVSPGALALLAVRDGATPAAASLRVNTPCEALPWQVNSDRSWLQPQVNDDTVTVNVDQAGLANGTYLGTLTITANGVNPVQVPVTLKVVEQLRLVYLPVAHAP